MSVLTVIKKVGEKVLSVVEYPFKHAAMIEELIADGLKDAPQTKTAIVGLVELIEGMGGDAVAAIAANGLNLPDDLKCGADLQAVFAYVKNTFLPAIEQDYSDIKSDLPSASATPTDGTNPAPGAAAVAGPGLHAVTAQ